MWIAPDAYIQMLWERQTSKYSPSRSYSKARYQGSIPSTQEHGDLRVPYWQWCYQENRCEACILARVGSDVSTLLALRASLLSRVRYWWEEPRLLRWVEAWIKNAAKDAADEHAMLKWSDEQGHLLHVVRKEGKAANRKRRSQNAKMVKATRQRTVISNSANSSQPNQNFHSHCQQSSDEEDLWEGWSHINTEEAHCNIGYERGAQSQVGSKFGDWQDYMQTAIAATVETEEGTISQKGRDNQTDTRRRFCEIGFQAGGVRTYPI
ncbi:hypothetical protein L228DRAFT_244797 [Xylona heveae TC161]|uniref:Uncharacterized protein n=1 Tax=Xylona heveae (strain CBS 132557 / TC161) TaxID=1328760 RepID=A0A165HUB6_XYLHT|nr:hypothetical protein L228DRAFT_244797 [Xylona heveae TC161]KZF23934.1 hypothetical protein L228DRAFT_244797 [Xylona heveae TC161]